MSNMFHISVSEILGAFFHEQVQPEALANKNSKKFPKDPQT